jgi:hypothetical protein
MRLAAFVIPFYFVFYVPPDESESEIYARYILFGFFFYALLAAVVITIMF